MIQFTEPYVSSLVWKSPKQVKKKKKEFLLSYNLHVFLELL